MAGKRQPLSPRLVLAVASQQERSPLGEGGRLGERKLEVALLTSVSSSILAPSACSRASRVSREEFPDLWSEMEKEKRGD